MGEHDPITHRCATCGSAYNLAELVDLSVPLRLPDCCILELPAIVMNVERQLVVTAAVLQQQLLIRTRDEQRFHLDKLADIAMTSNNAKLRGAAFRYRNKRYEEPNK